MEQQLIPLVTIHTKLTIQKRPVVMESAEMAAKYQIWKEMNQTAFTGTDRTLKMMTCEEYARNAMEERRWMSCWPKVIL